MIKLRSKPGTSTLSHPKQVHHKCWFRKGSPMVRQPMAGIPTLICRIFQVGISTRVAAIGCELQISRTVDHEPAEHEGRGKNPNRVPDPGLSEVGRAKTRPVSLKALQTGCLSTPNVPAT